MEFKEGQTYICTSTDEPWWTEGKEYKVSKNEVCNQLAIEDNTGTIFLEANVQLLTRTKFKLKEEKQMLKFKEGQTYICTESHASQWTEGKEYKVYFNTHAFALSDNNLNLWYEDELNEGKHKFKLKEETETTDLIDNQAHYKNQGIEPIELMRENFSKEEFAGFLQGNVLKYMLRYKDKNGLEDLKKAKTYLTWLIKEEEK
nr:MAG TPA: nucelotide kinase [Caudoviricetes sp.]